jgi:hypothetical protein
MRHHPVKKALFLVGEYGVRSLRKRSNLELMLRSKSYNASATELGELLWLNSNHRKPVAEQI